MSIILCVGMLIFKAKNGNKLNITNFSTTFSPNSSSGLKKLRNNYPILQTAALKNFFPLNVPTSILTFLIPVGLKMLSCFFPTFGVKIVCSKVAIPSWKEHTQFDNSSISVLPPLGLLNNRVHNKVFLYKYKKPLSALSCSKSCYRDSTARWFFRPICLER